MPNSKPVIYCATFHISLNEENINLFFELLSVKRNSRRIIDRTQKYDKCWKCTIKCIAKKKIVQEKDSNNAVKKVKVSINLRLLLR